MKDGSNNDSVRKQHLAGMAVALAAAGAAKAAEDEDEFLKGIRSEDEEANYKAWSTADQVDPSVVPTLCTLLTADKPNVRNAAAEALKNVTHGVGKTIDAARLGANVGRPDDPGRMDRRQQVVGQFLAVLGNNKSSELAKTTVLRHLSLIATSDAVPEIAKFLMDEALNEEAAFCLERIPGKLSEEAMLNALPSVADEFKPRILAAVGHRQAEEAAGVCIDAMRSDDATMAMAGMKAWARIGVTTDQEVQLPERDKLNEWQRIEYDDSLLRYADARLAKGDAAEAAAIYRDALAREEEHLQCAGIIGLAKIDSAEAAAAIFPKLDSDHNTVRITARKAWEEIANT